MVKGGMVGGEGGMVGGGVRKQRSEKLTVKTFECEER